MLGGSRTLIVIAALALLLLAPAPAAMALGVEDAQPVVDAVTPVVDAIDQGFIAPFQDSVDMVSAFMGQAIPSGPGNFGGGGTYIGSGHSTVTRVGDFTECSGTPTMVLEFSHKPFALEPTLSFTYGGGSSSGDPRVTPACASGRFDQADMTMIVGDLDGHFTATKNALGQSWTLDVGAPDASDQRSVSFQLMSDDGMTGDSFDGTLSAA